MKNSLRLLVLSGMLALLASPAAFADGPLGGGPGGNNPPPGTGGTSTTTSNTTMNSTTTSTTSTTTIIGEIITLLGGIGL